MRADLVKILYDKLSDLDLDDFKAIYVKNTPPTLIKFFNGSYKQDGSNIYLDSIKNNQLWASSPDEFNDPFDCAYNIGSNIDINKLKEQKRLFLETNSIKNNFVDSRMDLIIQKILTNNLKSFVCCFSEKDNLKNSVMWAHYSNCHKGFCVEYDTVSLQEKQNYVFPVKYEKDIDFFPNHIFFSDDAVRILNYYSFVMPYLKDSHWNYECEWRVLSTKANEDEKGHLIDVNTPKAIYIGVRASHQLKEDLKKICSNQKIELYQMRMKPNSFELIDEKVDIN